MYIIVSSVPINWGGVLFLVKLILVIAHLDWKGSVLLYIQAYFLIQPQCPIQNWLQASVENVMIYKVHVLYLSKLIA